MANAVSVAPSVNPIVAFARSAFSQFQEARKQRKAYKTTVRELQSLNNRELADLGLHRSMIRRLATQAAEDLTTR